MIQPTQAAVAECESCGGVWQLQSPHSPNLLEGVCRDCQDDSDTEKPLTFRRPKASELGRLPALPEGWLTED